jgi:hypothetical protein
MAKPIRLVLELKGDDARRFKAYADNPAIMPRGAELLKKAATAAKKRGII